jgi:DNA-binding response OmpR family regulator
MALVMADKGRILVVDDDRLVLATVSHGLSQAGYEVIDADNGDDAILLARQHKPDLALLDIRMEGKSGFDVAAYLREYLHTPFMFLSAFADEDTVQQVRALGAVAYLVKPLDIGQIVPTVEAAFANLASRGSAPPKSPSQAAEVAAQSLPTPSQNELVPMAVGVLMHRYSLQRGEAMRRLQKLAADEKRSLADQAERLVEAVELLARPGEA